MKKISAGIIIQNENDQFLVGHSTGNKFYDLFKGKTEDQETPLQTALRECQEESGLVIDGSLVKDLGLFTYNKEKNLHLFLYQINKQDIDMSKLKCTTYVVKPTYKYPEMDSFTWFSAEELLNNTAKSMNKIFVKLFAEGIIELKNPPLKDNLVQEPTKSKMKMR